MDDLAAKPISIKRTLIEKEVPKHRYSFWYYLGGLALFAFVIQTVTGILLVYYFEPGAATSHATLEMIVRRVPYGWLVRSLHAWSGSLAILLTFAHFVAAYFAKAFRGGGRSLWFTGVPMLVIMLAFGYTGMYLPRIQGSTLREFYTFHVVLLPLAACLVLGAHVVLSLFKRPDESLPAARVRYFPTYLLGEVIVWLLALIVLLIVAWVFRWEFGGSALAPAEALQLNVPSEWFLLWQRGWLDQLSGSLYWLCALVGVSAIFAIPIIYERTSAARRAKLFHNIGIAVIALLLAISVLAYFSSPG